MEEILENFFKEIDPLIEELRRREKITEKDLDLRIEIMHLKEQIREKTEQFIQDYKSACLNEIDRLNNEICICEDSEKRDNLEKELADAEKELDSFNEFMGDLDLSNSYYTYFLQTMMEIRKEKNTSRIVYEGKKGRTMYDHGRKIEDINTFTAGEALDIVNEEYDFQDTDLAEDATIEEQTDPVTYKENESDEIIMDDRIKGEATEEAVEDTKNEEQSKEYLEKLLGVFKKIEYGFDGLLPKEYLWLKERIIEDNQYEKAIKRLEGATLEDICVKILNYFKKDYPGRETLEKMLSAIKARREEMNKKDSQAVKEEENKPIQEVGIKLYEKPNYLTVGLKKKFDSIKKVGKRVKDWFVTKRTGNKKNEIQEEVITKNEEREVFMNTMQEGVEQPIIHIDLYKNSNENANEKVNEKVVKYDSNKKEEIDIA